MNGIKIKGKRIVLGAVKISDASTLVKFYNESRHFLGVPFASRMNIGQEKDFIRKQNQSKNNYFFAIRLIGSGVLIGTMSITINDTHSMTATTGTLISLKHVGHGYGTEAKHLLLGYAFNTLGLRKIYSEVFSYNPRSKAYSLKCGYIHEATLKDDKLHDEKYWDKWILSITRKQWLPVYEEHKKKHQLE